MLLLLPSCFAILRTQSLSPASDASTHNCKYIRRSVGLIRWEIKNKYVAICSDYPFASHSLRLHECWRFCVKVINLNLHFLRFQARWSWAIVREFSSNQLNFIRNFWKLNCNLALRKLHPSTRILRRPRSNQRRPSGLWIWAHISISFIHLHAARLDAACLCCSEKTSSEKKLRNFTRRTNARDDDDKVGFRRRGKKNEWETTRSM